MLGKNVLNPFCRNKDFPTYSAITVYKHLWQFTVERGTGERGRNDSEIERGRGSEIKVKYNGERVPPTVVVSSGRQKYVEG